MYFVKGIDKMKKNVICVLFAAVLMMLAMAACGGKDIVSSSGSASGEPAVVSQSEVTQPPVQTTTTAAPLVVEAKTYTWAAAETSAQYRADAAQRLDEFTDLLFTLTQLEDELRGSSAAKLENNKKFIAVRDSVSAYTRMINNYPTDMLPADCTRIHSLLLNLSGAADIYMESFSQFAASNSSADKQEQLNTIMDIVVEINSLLTPQ